MHRDEFVELVELVEIVCTPEPWLPRQPKFFSLCNFGEAGSVLTTHSF